MGAAFEHPTPNPALKWDVPQAARPLAPCSMPPAAAT